MAEAQIVQIIQLGALGILGALVILGFYLIRWTVQKWLPDIVGTIRTGFDQLSSSIEKETIHVRELNRAITDHDKKNSRFDAHTVRAEKAADHMIARLEEIFDRQEMQTRTIERLLEQNETLIKTIAVPRELLDTQNKLLEVISRRISSDDFMSE